MKEEKKGRGKDKRTDGIMNGIIRKRKKNKMKQESEEFMREGKRE